MYSKNHKNYPPNNSTDIKLWLDNLYNLLERNEIHNLVEYVLTPTDCKEWIELKKYVLNKLQVLEHDVLLDSPNWSFLIIVPDSSHTALCSATRLRQNLMKEIYFPVGYFENNTRQVANFGLRDKLHQLWKLIYVIFEGQKVSFQENLFR